MNLDREPLGEGNIVKQVSDRYGSKDETFLAVDGILSKDPNYCELFVDTHYLDYMLNNLNQESQFVFDDLRRKVQENTENIKSLLDSHDREFKWIQSQMIRTSHQSLRTDKLLTRMQINKFKYFRKKQLFGEWKKFLAIKKHKRDKTKNVLHLFWKFHAAQAFQRMKQTIRDEKIMKDKDKIDGAYLKIDDLYGQLKGFDKALERMFKDKANKSDLEWLKVSVDQNRAKTIFNDMKELYDTSMIEFKKSLENEKEKMREAFQYVISENREKCDKKDFISFNQKIKALESQISQLNLETLKIKENYSIQKLEFNINRQFDELAFQKQKIEQIEEDKDDMKTKVDYFIGLLQASSNLQASTNDQSSLIPFSNNNIHSQLINQYNKKRQSSADDDLTDFNYINGPTSLTNNKNSFQTLQQRADTRPKTSPWGQGSTRPKMNPSFNLKKNAFSNMQTLRGIQSAHSRRAQSTVDQISNTNFFITATPLNLNINQGTGVDNADAATACKTLVPVSSKQYNLSQSQRQQQAIMIKTPHDDPLEGISNNDIRNQQYSTIPEQKYKEDQIADIRIDTVGKDGNEEVSSKKFTYSLNPQLNKRIKTKRIEDLRQQAVKNVKKSLTLIEYTNGHNVKSKRSQRSTSFIGETEQNYQLDPPKTIAVKRHDQKYRRKYSNGINSVGGFTRTEKYNQGFSNDNTKLHTSVLLGGNDLNENI